jgi:hypothetical protein
VNFTLNELAQKEVTRKEFFSMCALGIGAVMGLGSMIKLLSGKSIGGADEPKDSNLPGYGKAPYGN